MIRNLPKFCLALGIAAVSYLAVDVALAVGVMPVATTYMTAEREPDYLLGLTAGMRKIGQRAKPDLIVAMRRSGGDLRL